MKRIVRILVALASVPLLIVFLAYGTQAVKRLPKGISYNGAPRPASAVQFMSDTTWVDAAGVRQSKQHIFDAVIGMIDSARELIVIDMFLFNEFQGPKPERTRSLADELTTALVRQKARYPEIHVVVISDPINTVYGGVESEHFAKLESAGVDVVLTNLDVLRDSNPVYSLFWRAFVRPFGNDHDGWLPNPFGNGKATVRSYLRLMNFKANHRKVVIADDGGLLTGLVTSANPHDGSSAHSNVALKFSGLAAIDLLESENAVLAFSGGPVLSYKPSVPYPTSDVIVRVVTENRIEEAVLATLGAAGAGDSIDLAMFYLSDRDVIRGLKEAQARGAALRVLLDPNKDAFGHEKNGIPNRQAAHELVEAGISVRWCHTHGEQCHSKLLISLPESRRSTLILGSANLTRRNLDNLNLETSVVVDALPTIEAVQAATDWFDAAWTNSSGRQQSVPYDVYAEESLIKRVLYRVMEASGLSSF